MRIQAILLLFQHTAARRRLVGHQNNRMAVVTFQHTAARRRLEFQKKAKRIEAVFQHTAARRRLDPSLPVLVVEGEFQHTAARRRLEIGRMGKQADGIGFNTQPPEGGWFYSSHYSVSYCYVFQHTAARRRLGVTQKNAESPANVSTHSRPKAAGLRRRSPRGRRAGFNTQPPEGGWIIHDTL